MWAVIFLLILPQLVFLVKPIVQCGRNGKYNCFGQQLLIVNGVCADIITILVNFRTRVFIFYLAAEALKTILLICVVTQLPLMASSSCFSLSLVPYPCLYFIFFSSLLWFCFSKLVFPPKSQEESSIIKKACQSQSSICDVMSWGFSISCRHPACGRGKCEWHGDLGGNGLPVGFHCLVSGKNIMKSKWV